MSETINILDYKVFSGNKYFFASETKGFICTLNPHSYILSRKDQQFKIALRSATWLIPDGSGIQLAARILQGKKIDKIAGSDLHEIIINSLDEKEGSCFYLGSSDETLNKIRQRLWREHPSVKVGTFSPPFTEKFSKEENDEIISIINAFSPDVLFIGMTAPKQEKWAYEHLPGLNVPLICPVGAVFDFYSGTVRRPGKTWIRLGLEWLPRFLREPKRLWKRNFISTPLFLYYVFAEKARKAFKRNE